MSSKALLVGINSYPSAPLSGCVNDVHSVATLLAQNYGMSGDQVCILKDNQATTANIMAKLEWLVSDVQPGDRILFWYSGHGAQYPTRDTSETDGLSEVICPVDFAWSPRRMITDKQLVQVFSRMPDGVLFNWGSDSCHAGDLTRGVPMPPRNGPLQAILRPFANLWGMAFGQVRQKSKFFPTPSHIMNRVRLARANGHGQRGMTGGMLDVGFVSGCQSSQTSADTSMGGQPCGAMTWFFVRHLRATPDAPLSEVVAATSRDLAATGYQQRPQAEGARRDRPFLR